MAPSTAEAIRNVSDLKEQPIFDCIKLFVAFMSNH